jgi:SAM-dependent methyltransferase
MAGWDDGYVTDVVYTTNFYREITPAWLATTCLLLGQRPPDLTRPFRYADLGCGHGFTAMVVAATCPHAEVWAFDFNPAHVEWATRLASNAGLSNVHFVEASFAELAARPEAALPAFDFIVSHGVLSWVSAENRRLLMDVIRQRLRPGGLAYLSYNVTTGWTGMLPLRRLMRLLEEANPARTDLTATPILDFIDRMRTAGALFFPANPTIEPRLEDIRKQDPRYIAHEYLNRDWDPLMFADVAEAMADTKCSFIGSATLSENIDALAAPATMVPLLAEMPDQVLHQTVRDFASAQSFRRDVFRRGRSQLPSNEHHAMLDALTIAPMGQTVPDPITFTTPIGMVTGHNEIYRPLFDMLMQGPVSLRQARQAEAFADRPLPELLQAITLMIGGGYAHPVLQGGGTPEARQATAHLNRAIAAANGHGAELHRLAAPLVGSALQVDLLETLMVDDLLAGRPSDMASLTVFVLDALERTGRAIQREGVPVTDPAEKQSMAGDVVQRFLERRVPLLRTLGVL